MPVESVGVTEQPVTAQSQTTELGQEDLFKILLTELSFQDPLEPMDNREFIAQLAQFTNLEQMRTLNEKVDSVLTVQASDQSILLLGKTVEVRTDVNPELGDVIAINFNEEGSPLLTVQKPDGTFLTDVRLSQIKSIK